MTFFYQTFTFNQHFHMFGQQVLTKIFTSERKYSIFAYTTLTFGFFYNLLWSRNYFSYL
eukprot:UN15086